MSDVVGAIYGRLTLTNMTNDVGGVMKEELEKMLARSLRDFASQDYAKYEAYRRVRRILDLAKLSVGYDLDDEHDVEEASAIFEIQEPDLTFYTGYEPKIQVPIKVYLERIAGETADWIEFDLAPVIDSVDIFYSGRDKPTVIDFFGYKFSANEEPEPKKLREKLSETIAYKANERP